MTKSAGAVVIAALITGAPAAHAQVIQPPPRPSRAAPSAPSPLTQTLSASGSLLGSFDDASGAGTTSGVFAPGVPTIGPGGNTHGERYSGFGNAALRYSIGTNDRSLSASGSGFSTTVGRDARLKYGGNGTVQARTSLGRRMTFSAGHSRSVDPLSDLGLFAAVPAGANSPSTNPLNGFVARRSLSSSTNASVRRDWTRRLRTELAYGLNNRTFDDGLGFDDTSQNGRFGIDYSVGRSTGFQSDYRYSESRYVQPDGTTHDLATHSITTGFRTEAWLTRTRALTMSINVGATRAERRRGFTNQLFAPWTPSGSANLAMALGRSWSASSNYQRMYSTVQGAEPFVYLTDATSGSLGGMLGRRLESTFTVAHSAGRHRDPLQGYPVTYVSTTGTAQLRFAVTERLSALVSYTHLRFHMDDPIRLSQGIFIQMHRHSARIGLMWSQPLVGGGRTGRQPRN